MYLRLTTFTKKKPPPNVISPIICFAILISLWGSTQSRLCWLLERSYRQLPATVSNVCTTDARVGGVGRVPPPPTKIRLLRWLSKPIIKLELSESCCGMYTKCIQCQYHIYNLLNIYLIQWTDFVYFLKTVKYSPFQHMSCDFAHGMVSMWCNRCNLVAFDRWHLEWHIYTVSSTWMHFLKFNIVATNFACGFLETCCLRHLLDSIEPHFLFSRQNGLNFLTQYLNDTIYTVDRPVFLNTVSAFKKRALNVHRRLRFMKTIF